MKKPRLLAALLLIQTDQALAEDDNQKDQGFWYAQTSVYTRHYSPDPRTQ